MESRKSNKKRRTAATRGNTGLMHERCSKHRAMEQKIKKVETKDKKTQQRFNRKAEYRVRDKKKSRSLIQLRSTFPRVAIVLVAVDELPT